MNREPVEDFELLVAELMRSVVAGSRRHRAMREELLAHLRQAYEEELSLGVDESAARHAAVRRFGDLAELQSQLSRRGVDSYNGTLGIEGETAHVSTQPADAAVAEDAGAHACRSISVVWHGT